MTAKVLIIPEKEGTRTDLAENLALTEVFTQEGGDRPSAMNVMLVITDGIPYIAKWDKEPKIPFPELTAALEVIKFKVNFRSLTYPCIIM